MGGALLAEFSHSHATLGTYRSYPVEGLLSVDIGDIAILTRLVDEFAPQVILQAAALTNVDYCEIHPDEAWRVNVESSRNVAQAAARIGAKHVFFSSEYVFDGASGPYTEEDPPSPISVYGRCALAAEEGVEAPTDDYLIIRTTVVYGWERQGKNFVVRLLKSLREGRKVKVPMDQISSPTYAPNLAQAVRELVERDRCGVYNVVGDDLMDRYSFALAAARVFSLPTHLIRPVSTAELNQAAPRPLRAGLKVDKVRTEIVTPLLGVKKGLVTMLEEQ